MQAAPEEAAEVQNALASRCTTDPLTMARVLARLRRQMAGVDVLSRHEYLKLPADTIERRTCTRPPVLYARRQS